MRSVELFTGAGGLALGLSSAGFQHQLMVEWDRPACQTVEHNKELGVSPVAHWPLRCGDVRDIDFSALGEGLDLVAGGPPCQPFSIGGKHRGASDHRDMWPQAIRAVRELRPRAFLFENVRGLLRESFKDYLRYVELQLRWPELARGPDEDWADHLTRLTKHDRNSKGEGLHYRVEVHPVDAANYGAAQNRKRVIIVGIRCDISTSFNFPAETHSRAALLWDQSSEGAYWERHGVPKKERPAVEKPHTSYPPAGAPWVTVRDAIGDLPEPCSIRPPVPNHRYQPGARTYVGHTGSPLDLPAKALKAGAHGVPGGENMLRRNDGSVRYFTVREAARLQGFPDEYVFPEEVAWSEAMRQLGNAVPVPLARAVAEALVKTLVQTPSVTPRRSAAA